MLLINFKTYRESSGANAVTLANNVFGLSKEFGIPAVVCPNMLDVKDIARDHGGGTWAQHCDFFDRGRATGWVPPEILKEIGVTGVVLNHSEHKLPFENLKKIVDRSKTLELKVLIFSDSIEETLSVSALSPDWIGYEPPELVGSTETSVARAKPEVIEKVVKAVPNIPILVGAGVKDTEDVRVSLRLGARGVGVASGVVLAADQKGAVRQLLEGWR
ncbi:MAG: Triosephosphate isomerase [Candidatus Curtissbacteria bacterium GW2011_GWA1_40_16]|uniref:Triosephosphate isomerase n=1 Tax=Candidatus Curtissbacteria bacterium GW2011_GWA1_40_16 TaxID=1618405 RepID=A0A0G0RBU4_9BACT|nr:MAG: Triosephosphate isomerase [Candidatus Curtissbacteria bacterium GW2011_GWA1_40_16]